MLRKYFSKSYGSYKQALDDAFNRKNLFYTNILLSMGVSGAGDIIEQSYEYITEAIKNYDWHRTGHMVFSGATVGFICHHWYKFLDTVIIGKSFKMVVKKLALDQFICSPLIILSFFATVALFEDNPVSNFTDEVKDKFWTLYKAEWFVWPPAQLINFYFVPTQYRVMYDNVISLGYDVYTSQVKHDKTGKTERHEQTKKEEKSE